MRLRALRRVRLSSFSSVGINATVHARGCECHVQAWSRGVIVFPRLRVAQVMIKRNLENWLCVSRVSVPRSARRVLLGSPG